MGDHEKGHSLSIDEQTLEAGRAYAQAHQTSLNALIRDLQEFFIDATGKLGIPDLEAKEIIRAWSRFEVVGIDPSRINESCRSESFLA